MPIFVVAFRFVCLLFCALSLLSILFIFPFFFLKKQIIIDQKHAQTDTHRETLYPAIMIISLFLYTGAHTAHIYSHTHLTYRQLFYTYAVRPRTYSPSKDPSKKQERNAKDGGNQKQNKNRTAQKQKTNNDFSSIHYLKLIKSYYTMSFNVLLCVYPIPTSPPPLVPRKPRST